MEKHQRKGIQDKKHQRMCFQRKANLLIICKANRQAIFTLSSLGCHREPREPYNIVDLVLLMMMN
ncbi:hypothetical protein MAR_038531, partial [Mya arenaria]